MGVEIKNLSENIFIKFSIIIPVYNVEKFLVECLESIVSQTFPHFEVICVNDGSTDNSLAILQEYANKDSRFKLISQENQGQGIARNKGIDLAKGEYILFVDPDDFIQPNTLEVLDAKFQQADVDIIQLDYMTCKENGSSCRTKTFKNRMKKYFGYLIKDNQIFNWKDVKKKNLEKMFLVSWDKAYKLGFLKKYNIKFAENKIGEDQIFSISTNFLADRILYINKAFYTYRKRYNSALNNVSSNNFCVFENIELLRNFLISNNLYEEYKTNFEKYLSTVLCWHYSGIPEDKKEEYLSKCKELLTPQNYELLLEKIQGHLSLAEKLFSLKNRKINGSKVKCLTILGVSFYCE